MRKFADRKADIDPELLSQLREKFKGMMSALYREEGASLRIEILEQEDVTGFIDTHAAVLDSSFAKTEMSELMRSRLQESDWIFSGMKTFHELHEAFPSLLDEDGNRKPFEQFLRDVQSIDETYNSTWLNAEYNFAQASAEMAGKWEDYAADGDDYYLQYRTQRDDKVRPEHAELHGVTLPPSDSFWDTYWPPNGWNCRCTVAQIRKEGAVPTDHDEAMRLGKLALKGDKKEMFAFNPGKQQKTFPDYNPYTISKCKTCPKAGVKLAADNNEICNVCALMKQDIFTKTKEGRRAEYERLMRDPDYIDVQYNEDTGGVRATSVSHKTDGPKEQKVLGDFTGKQLEVRCQDNLYRMGEVCILEPETIRINDHWISCLDATIAGERMDIASITKADGNIFFNTICRKEKQLIKYNAAFGESADSLAIYFEKREMYSKEAIIEALTRYKSAPHYTHQISRIFCILNRGDKLIILQ